jgi:hypothetical protein
MMVWIVDKLLGSDLELKGPELSKAPWLQLDLSGTKLRYRDPRHTAMFPAKAFAYDMDLYDAESYERDTDGDLVKLFYLKGWAFIGRNRPGGVDLAGRILLRDKNIPADFNYFDRRHFDSAVLFFCHSVWGRQNNSERLGDLGTGFFKYPIGSSELLFLNINNVKWCYFTAQARGKPPRMLYATPITAHHILVLDFKPMAYLDWDFYSPDSNLEDATHQFVKEFMDNFYVELSDEAKAQRATAKDPI